MGSGGKKVGTFAKAIAVGVPRSITDALISSGE